MRILDAIRILDANMNFVNKENAKNDKICKKKSKRDSFGEKSEKNKKSYKRPNKSSRICGPSFGIAQITRNSADSISQGGLAEIR